MKKIFKKLTRLIAKCLILLPFFSVSSAAAETTEKAILKIKNVTEITGGMAGLNTNIEPAAAVGKIMNGLFGFLGMIFIILIIYGGFTWMTAGGNEEKVSKAKKILANSTIGLLVVVLSYTIAKMILTIFKQAGV